jgi:hypothetical protein
LGSSVRASKDPGEANRTSRVGVDLTLALVVSTLALACLLATGPQFGMIWDEGYTVERERRLAEWFHRLASSQTERGVRHAFEKPELDRYWPFSREEPHGHPPFYALLGLTGWWLSHGCRPALEAYRFGPMVLTALTTGILYFHLARRRGRLAGITAASLVLLMPRSFAHAHYAHYDMPMTCLWLLAQVAFAASLRSRRWAVLVGVLLGLAAGTKFTGLFAVVPLLIWVILFELLPRMVRSPLRVAGSAPLASDGLKTLAIALPIAALTLYAIQPAWWLEPLAGPYRFLISNLSRSKTQPLATFYLGRTYEFSLPWHNTLVLTAITTPLLTLILGMIGVAACVRQRREEPWALIWPLSWATLMVVRALPNAPGHDGIRLFLPSLASLAILAALGLDWLCSRFPLRWRRIVGPLLAATAIAECVVGIARTYPYTDSYYNFAVGGLRGAERRGFELTYYWETSGREFLVWAKEQARRRPISLCFSMDATNHRLLREWGEIPHDIDILDLNTPDSRRPSQPDFYVQQRRRGLYYPADWWLERHGHSVFAVRREAVDLLRVYTFQDFLEANRQTRNQPIPRHLFR